MLLHLPSDIVQSYIPKKNEEFFSIIKEQVMKYYDWNPLDNSSLQAVRDFLTNEIGMVEIRLDDTQENILPFLQSRIPEKLKYECTYTFPDAFVRDRWALPEEKEMYATDEKYYKIFVHEVQKKIASGNADSEMWGLRLEREHKVQQITVHHLIHLYSADNFFFGAVDMQGMVPKIVRYSLFHLLGKAPIPEETYSEWYMYLQFLIDIGYVKEV